LALQGGDQSAHTPLQVPFLEDPNSGVCLFESEAIIKYLEDTYAVQQ
jgi:glutathione S-transferase